MKNICSIISQTAFVAILLSACNEIEPVIPPLGPSDTGDRKILIEEFTGVTCVNCPGGSAKIEELILLNNENVIAVSIHAGDFAEPINSSLYDFRTTEGDNLLDYLGAPIGYPSSVINRKKYPSEGSLQVNSLTSWAGYSAQELAEPARLSLALERTYNPANRELVVNVNGTALANIGNDNSLSLLITESNIFDYQTTPSGSVYDYNHKHVLRGYITPFNGQALSENLTLGTAIQRQFTYTLPENWKPEDCHVIAFVHKTSNTDKSIIQVEEIDVAE